MAPPALDQGRLLRLAGPAPPWRRAHGFPVELFAVTDIAVARNGTGELGAKGYECLSIDLAEANFSGASAISRKPTALHGR